MSARCRPHIASYSRPSTAHNPARLDRSGPPAGALYGRCSRRGLLMSAQGIFFCSLRRKFGDRRIGESLLDHGRGLVESSMERTKLALVMSAAQRAAFDPLDAIHDVYDIEDGDLVGLAAQDESAAAPGSGPNQIGAGQFLKNLGHVPNRHLGRLGDVTCADGDVGPTGDPNDRPQCIFRSQRNHPDSRSGRWQDPPAEPISHRTFRRPQYQHGCPG